MQAITDHDLCLIKDSMYGSMIKKKQVNGGLSPTTSLLLCYNAIYSLMLMLFFIVYNCFEIIKIERIGGFRFRYNFFIKTGF